MKVRKFIPSISIILFMALTLVGTYVVRKMILERHMSIVLELKDNAAIADLVNAWPCPVHAHDNLFRTPLHWAIRRGRADLARRLSNKAGAKVIGLSSFFLPKAPISIRRLRA